MDPAPSPGSPRPIRPAGFSPSQGLLLAAVVAVGLGLRWAAVARAGCFWDEGLFVEVVRGLAAGHRPQAGGLWEDGFFPLSASWLAPLSAAPFVALVPQRLALDAARLWAVLLEGLTLLSLARLGRKLGGPRLGLAAAALYACMPFAVVYGGRCFYHHLAVALLTASLADGVDLFTEAEPRHLGRASLLLGTAAAAAYWLCWLPLAWIGLLLWRRAGRLGAHLALLAAAPVAAVLPALLLDPAGAWWSLRCLAVGSHAGKAAGPLGRLRAWGADLAGVPLLAAGLLGAAAGLRRAPRAWVWPALALALAAFEPMRQRGDITRLSYPFMPAAPLAALAAMAPLAGGPFPRTWRARILAACLPALALLPVRTGWMRSLSLPSGPMRGLCAFLRAHSRPGDGVCGMPEFDWRLPPDLRVCDPFGVGAAEGRTTGFYVPGAPASRLAWDCRVPELRYAVLCRVDVLAAFRIQGIPLAFLEMERSGWREVFDNGSYRVYENPRFGAAPQPDDGILSAPPFYRLAALDAAESGRPADAAYALARARALSANRGSARAPLPPRPAGAPASPPER